ncbi:hypothetical protein [Cohnella nanjingensis]|uniref:Uncharacterized protein n=1 Tax=Cohnella nanjingensis TaxID=1387779 RepID=A0A7X0RQP5_9BACL|nr:hypothetical protein [Cohnella nanjingensis]MBB6671937.1 hypothetical protein [Cohnella nanjingensis]
MQPEEADPSRIDPSEALANRYAQFTEMLDRELGVGPSLVVKAVYEQLLSELA